jgi:hypothetical protein
MKVGNLGVFNLAVAASADDGGANALSQRVYGNHFAGIGSIAFL